MNEAVQSALFDSPPSSPGPLAGVASSEREEEVPHLPSPTASDVIEIEGRGPEVHGNDTDLMIRVVATHSQVQDRERQQGDPARGETIAAPSTTSEQRVNDTTARVTIAADQSSGRPATIQTTLTAAVLRPPALPPPQLPNLALAALQRLAERTEDHDDSLDDFRPLKKRKLTNDTVQGSEEEQEVNIQ